MTTATAETRPKMTPRERVLEACIALVDCDDQNEDAWHACWERLRLAASDWLTPPDQQRKALTKDAIRHGFEALLALQEPLGTAELAERLGVCQRSAQELVQAMQAAALPLQSMRCRNGRRVRYRLAGPRWHLSGNKPGAVAFVYQLELWPKEG
jgi:hypothetical protein